MLEKLISKRLWDSAYKKAGWSGVAALVVLAGAIAFCEQAAVETVTHDLVTGCSENEDSQSRRAAQVLSAVIERYGEPTREQHGGDTLVFDSPKGPDHPPPRFELVVEDSASDPCWWKLFAFAYVGEIGNDDKLKAALDDHAIGRRYESSGIWIHRHDGSLWLMKGEELRKLDGKSLFWLENHLGVAEAWGGGWLGEVREIAAGRAPPPKRHVYRPGRDPKTVLEGVERFLKDAGVRR